MTEFYQLDLFAGSSSSTAVFQICPKEAENSPLHDFIELCGGIVLEPGDWDPYVISIIDIEWMQRNRKAILESVKPPDDHFHPYFIYDCYRTKTAQDLNKYLLAGSAFEPYDANLILKRKLKWEDLIVRKSAESPLMSSHKPTARKTRKYQDVPLSPEVENIQIDNLSAADTPATETEKTENDDEDIESDTKGPSVRVEMSCNQELTLLNHPESDSSVTADNDDSDSAGSVKRKKSPVKKRMSLSERTVVLKSPSKMADRGRDAILNPRRTWSTEVIRERSVTEENTSLPDKSGRHLRRKGAVRSAQRRVTRKQYKSLTAPVVDLSGSDGETSKSSFIASLGLVASKKTCKPDNEDNQEVLLSDSSGGEDNNLSLNLNGNEESEEQMGLEVQQQDDEEQIADEITDYSSDEFRKSDESEKAVEREECNDAHESPTKFKTVSLSEKTELVISPGHTGLPCNIFQNCSRSEESQEEIETIATENRRRRAKALRQGNKSSSEDTVGVPENSPSKLNNGSPRTSKLRPHANGRRLAEPPPKRVCRRNETPSEIVHELTSSSENEDSDDSCEFVVHRKLPVRNANSVKYQVEDVLGESDLSDTEYPCAFCDFKAVDRVSVIKHVAKKHVNQKLYSCSYCNFRGTTSYELRVHRSNAHDT